MDLKLNSPKTGFLHQLQVLISQSGAGNSWMLRFKSQNAHIGSVGLCQANSHC